jgi:hypothetical protein
MFVAGAEGMAEAAKSLPKNKVQFRLHVDGHALRTGDPADQGQPWVQAVQKPVLAGGANRQVTTVLENKHRVTLPAVAAHELPLVDNALGADPAGAMLLMTIAATASTSASSSASGRLSVAACSRLFRSFHRRCSSSSRLGRLLLVCYFKYIGKS